MPESDACFSAAAAVLVVDAEADTAAAGALVLTGGGAELLCLALDLALCTNLLVTLSAAFFGACRLCVHRALSGKEALLATACGCASSANRGTDSQMVETMWINKNTVCQTSLPFGPHHCAVVLSAG